MTKFSDEAADYTVLLLWETGAAWGVSTDDEDDTALGLIWLPKSQCEFPSGCKVGQTVEVTVPNWLAEEKGLI